MSDEEVRGSKEGLVPITLRAFVPREAYERFRRMAERSGLPLEEYLRCCLWEGLEARGYSFEKLQ
jgi:hypothetical protein